MKICKKCGASKNESDFTKRSNQKDGLHYHCKPCCADYNAAWQAANKKKVRAYLAEYYLSNQDKLRTRSNDRRKTKAEAVLAYDAERRRLNPGRCRENKAAWEKRNPAAMTAKAARRRAALRRGQPPWIKTYAKEMKEFYTECRKLGLTADHIVPLQGKTVSGLHVPWNLQMLTLRENSSKSNRLIAGHPLVRW